MKKIVVFFLLVAAIAAVSAVFTLRLSSGSGSCASSKHTCSADDWLHSELRLTAEQKKSLAPIDTRFHEEYRLATEQLAIAKRELSACLGKSDKLSPEVSAAIEKVHHRMGELQKISIQHVYDMRPVLTPTQWDCLVRCTQQALETSH